MGQQLLWWKNAENHQEHYRVRHFSSQSERRVVAERFPLPKQVALTKIQAPAYNAITLLAKLEKRGVNNAAISFVNGMGVNTGSEDANEKAKLLRNDMENDALTIVE